MQMSDYKISTKLVAAFCAVALIGAALGAFALFNMKRINDADTRLYERELVGLSLIKEANAQRLQALVAVRDTLLATDAQERDQALALMSEARKKYADLLEQAAKLSTSDKGRAALADLRALSEKDQQIAQDLVKRIQATDLSGSNESIKFIKSDVTPHGIQVDRALTALSQLKEVEAKAVSDGNDALYENSRNITVTLILLGVAAGVGLGLAISRHVTAPLAHAAAGARAMSEGDMTQDLSVSGKDETSQLLQALDEMRRRLQGIVSSVRENSESVATGSGQIAQGNADLSQRTEEQASALEETAATMDELSSTVRNNADNAKQANQLALSASTVAQQGGAVVGEVVETMKGINDSSKKISDIISVIDGIAFQTNILALNAAVEAARAGEQGRGFAVVASEVRSLAQRSAEAAKEIKTLINASVERVELGTALVDKAGVTMTEIVGSIRRVADIVGEISAASSEQSSGIAQVGEAITQMDKVTQQNAALVEESAAAAESLRQQADQLVQVVAVFKLR
ncbi:methyl-accepting chemotaxis protein [Roseateles albus]|uniref:Methyl-accepting chemotaxis protein n=1 Tax=Roseateles albus TaxID=2987525 RepID=A0ABT5KCE2_9BURK|nr:methyl-accepting chemotaxis protein [Roseateles albus]MDC8771229.1 methyl-accepting chemotaxis protein [Roseateles albus]